MRIRTLIGLASLTAIAAHPAAAQDVTLKLHHFNPPTTTMHRKFIMPWVEMVKKKTGGRIKIDVYPSLQLGGKPQQLLDQVRDGVVDITWTITGYTPGRFPSLEAFELPFVHQSIASTNQALYELQKTVLKEELKDYKVLVLHVHAGNVLITKGKPIRTVADFKGMKIRTPNQSGSWFLEAVDANPVGTPITAVAQLLSRGVIDGAALPFEIIGPFKLHELTKYATELAGGKRFQTTVFILAMNKAKYESLPPDLKKLFDETTGETLVKLATKVWEAAEEPGIEAAKKRGNEFITMAPAEVAKMKELAEPVIARWIAAMKDRGVDGSKLLQVVRDTIAKYDK